MRGAVIVAALWLVAAPFQCASDPDPERAIEDSAPEALWNLAEEFRERGDADARRTTLEHIVERYPSSRFAQRAEQELGRSRGASDGD